MNFRLDIQRDIETESVDEMFDALGSELRDILKNLGEARKNSVRRNSYGLTILKTPEDFKKKKDKTCAGAILDKAIVCSFTMADTYSGGITVRAEDLTREEYYWLKNLLKEKAERKCDDDE